MRILIEQGIYLEGLRGIGTYVQNLVKSLARVASDDHFILFGFFFRDFHNKLKQIYRPDAPNFELALKRWPESIVTRLEWHWNIPIIDSFCRGRKVDVYHAPGIRLPALSRAAGVLTVHDLVGEVHPEFLPESTRSAWSALCRYHIERARLLMADSECTKRDLIERFKVPENKIRVIYLGIDHEVFSPSTDSQAAGALRAKFSLKERYVISVGPWEPRRNLETELRAFRLLISWPETADCGLVLVGSAQSSVAESLRRQIAELGLSDKVLWLGYVSQEDLVGLYRLADAYVYPSWYDGYNMPMLEAMSCGTPVLVSNAGVLPELGQDACLYFDPGDAQAMAETIRQVLTDRSLAEDLRRKGFIRTNDFQWEKTALQVLKVYHEAVD